MIGGFKSPPLGEGNYPEILIVEDDYVSNLILTKYLSQFNCKNFLVKNNGREALDYLKGLPENEFPKIIFLDIKMPVMNGFEFLEEFRSSFSELLEQTRVYILTSSVSRHDINLAREFQFIKSFIQKPINPLQLREITNC